MIETINANCLDVLKETAANSQDLIFCDPPYALGSDVIIRKDGKPDYRKAVDFMSKWQQPDGYFWEQWFAEAFRVLRYGGRVVMFGMDRQLMLNKYYACFAGFSEQQSLYWYFISNFPKATDLSKQIDKRGGGNFDTNQIAKAIKEARLKRKMTVSECDKLFCDSSTNWTWFEGRKAGVRPPTYDTFMKIAKEWQELLPLAEVVKEAEREVIGKGSAGFLEKNNSFEIDNEGYGNYNLTAPSTELAKKYEGYKYSISPLKQTNETIMVFQKPYKTGSCLHDTLAYENGDDTCMCGAVDVEGNRCGIDENEPNKRTNAKNHKRTVDNGVTEYGQGNMKIKDGKHACLHDLGFHNSNGRYPAQTYCDDEAAKVLDRQSGVQKGSDSIRNNKNSVTTGKDSNTSCYGKYNDCTTKGHADTGGCSRILHRCNYDLNDYDIYMYCPKVSNKERNEGCGMLEKKRAELRTDTAAGIWKDANPPQENHHPTVKPISLLKKIIQLFKTPNPLHVLDPFMGSGSMGIACIELGVSYTGVELDAEYYTIAQTRLAHHNTKNKSKLF